MPPPEAHKPLRKEQVALLRRWIEEGAEYQEHWAFVKPVREPLPPVKRREWGKNAIDGFVLARIRVFDAPGYVRDEPVLPRGHISKGVLV